MFKEGELHRKKWKVHQMYEADFFFFIFLWVFPLFLSCNWVGGASIWGRGKVTRWAEPQSQAAFYWIWGGRDIKSKTLHVWALTACQLVYFPSALSPPRSFYFYFNLFTFAPRCCRTVVWTLQGLCCWRRRGFYTKYFK